MTERMSLAQFKDLGRDEMVKVLQARDASLVKGKTRAKKDELVEIFRTSLMDELGELSKKAPAIVHVEALKKEQEDAGVKIVVPGKDGGDPQVFSDPQAAIAAMKAQGGLEMLDGDNARKRLSEMLGPVFSGERLEAPHVHGPDCGHDHQEFPVLAGMEDLERVNPEMPVMPFQDGAVIAIPPPSGPATEPDFVLKNTGQPGELTEKQKRIVDRFIANYNAFCNNPQNSTARREAKSAIYDLKINGVILHPKFEAGLAQGAANVREARRQWAAGGGSVKELAAKSTAEEKSA